MFWDTHCKCLVWYLISLRSKIWRSHTLQPESRDHWESVRWTFVLSGSSCSKYASPLKWHACSSLVWSILNLIVGMTIECYFITMQKKKKKPFLSCKSLVVVVAIPLDQFHICKDISSMCKTVPFELVLSIKAGPGHSLSAYDLSKSNLSACFIGVFSILAAFSQYAQLSSFPMVLGPWFARVGVITGRLSLGIEEAYLQAGNQFHSLSVSDYSLLIIYGCLEVTE